MQEMQLSSSYMHFIQKHPIL